jgi:hypothetical protein
MNYAKINRPIQFSGPPARATRLSIRIGRKPFGLFAAPSLAEEKPVAGWDGGSAERIRRSPVGL